MGIENESLNLTGTRIKKMRLEKQLTQKELADELGLKNDTAIANYEAGYSIPKDDIKLKMCQFFECSTDYLMGKSYYKNAQIRQKNINYTIAALEFSDTDFKKMIDGILTELIIESKSINRKNVNVNELESIIDSLLNANAGFPDELKKSAQTILKTIFLDYLEKNVLFTNVQTFMIEYSQSNENNENSFDEIRAIARDVAKLNPEKKELFKNLLKQMSDEADEASKK